MNTRPGPSELVVLLNPQHDIEQHRNLFCSRYEACLDEAISREWTSWTCAQCVLFGARVRLRAESCMTAA